MLSTPRRVLSATSAVLVTSAAIAAVAFAPAASAADSCGATYTWKSDAANSNWSDPGNWTVGGASDGTVPGTTSAVLIPSAVHTPTLDASAPTELCSLTLGTGGRLTVNAVVAVDGSTTLGAGSQLALDNKFTAFGGITLGSGSEVAGAGAEEGGLTVDVGLTLAGNATMADVGVALEPNRPVSTAGHTLTLDAAVLVLLTGDRVTSTPGGGAVLARNIGGVALDGNASIGAGASLKIGSEGALVGLGASTVTLSGAGALTWMARGSVGGAITLANPLHTTVSGAGVHGLGDTGIGKTTLTNKSAHFVLASGSLDEQDANTAFRNAGTVTQSGGSLAAHASTAPAFVNAAGAHWNVTARAGRTISVKGSLTNSGTLSVPVGVKLKISRTFKQVSTGALRLALRGTSTSKHAAVIAGKLSLAGKLQLQSAPSYKPKAGVTLNSIVAGKRQGKFTKVSSKTYRKHTKWTATYSTKAVNAKLITN